MIRKRGHSLTKGVEVRASNCVWEPFWDEFVFRLPKGNFLYFLVVKN